jgi:hypothetical protein
MHNFILLTSLLFALNSIAMSTPTSTPVALVEKDLFYDIKLNHLEEGNFQYFFSLIHPTEDLSYKNLYDSFVTTKTSKILEVFFPLDTKKLWDIKEKNHLAVVKMNYTLPVNIHELSEDKLKSIDYLQQTMPKNKIIKIDNHYHVEGTLLTPEFDLYIDFYNSDHPLFEKFNEIDQKKIKAKKMKVSFQFQDNFGRVMMFKTAKMASAVSIYEEIKPNLVLVTQYILSNIINVPTERMIRNSMIANIQDVVRGTRSSVKNK